MATNRLVVVVMAINMTLFILAIVGAVLCIALFISEITGSTVKTASSTIESVDSTGSITHSPIIAAKTVWEKAKIVAEQQWEAIKNLLANKHYFITTNLEEDHYLITSASVNETIIRELKRRHQKNYEDFLSAAEKKSNDFDELLNKRDIGKITTWKPITGYKATLDILFNERAQFLKGDIVKISAEYSEATDFVDLMNLTMYSKGKVNTPNSSNREAFYFFYSCEDSLLGLETTDELPVNYTATLSLKKNAEFLEMSGGLNAYGKNVFGEDAIGDVPTSWAELSRSLVNMFYNRAGFSYIIKDVNKTSMLTRYASFSSKEHNSWVGMRIAPIILYNCTSTRENIIEIPWPTERVNLTMSDKTSTAILYEERATNASYMKLSGDLTTERFQFKPIENNITIHSLRNKIEYDRRSDIVRIWDVKNNGIYVNNKTSMSCFNNNSVNAFKISQDFLVVKMGDHRISFRGSYIKFWKKQSACRIDILPEKLKDKEFKMNETCWGDDFSANLIVHNGQLRAIHGNATLTLFLSHNSMRLETPMGNVTLNDRETVLNCDWATARFSWKSFLFYIWYDNVEMNGDYNMGLYSDDFIIINSEHVNISMSQTKTEITTVLSKIVLGGRLFY